MRLFILRTFFALLPAIGLSFTVDATGKPFDSGVEAFQQPPYKGRVVSAANNPVKFAAVKTESGKVVFTDKNGFFTLDGTEGQVLTINVKGFKLTSYTLTASPEFTITVEPDDTVVLKNVKPVELIYTRVAAPLAIASNSVVYNQDLVKAPVTSVRNAVIGRLAGLTTLQSSGQPGGADAVSLSLRGQTPLIIIDGIPREITLLDMEEIESVTVLKDALATAALGVRGSRGALLITTRKGSPARQEISFTAQTAFQKPLYMPKALNAYDYSRLYNEALVNEGLSPVYTDADLNAFKTGSNPYQYPDVNWSEQLLRKSSRFDRYTISATGGNAFARYFVALEHINQTGLLRTSDSNEYNTNNSFKSYIIRSNVDLTINPKVSGGIYIMGRILNGNEPGSTVGGIFNSILSTPNNAYPIFNPDSSFGGSNIFANNIWAQSVGSGYRQNYKRDMLADVYLKRTLDEITKGLSVRVLGSFNAGLSENINRSKNFAVFAPSGTSYQQFGTNTAQVNSNGIETQQRSNYLELKLEYEQALNKDHGLNAFLLANHHYMVEGSDLPYIINGGSGRVAYNYKAKYLAEVAFGLNGSNRYDTDGSTNYGFFPAFGLGWNIANEDFLKSQSWLNTLKLYGSYGKTGWDDPGYYTFIQRYFDAATTYFGTGAGGNTSIAEQPIARQHLTWEKANKLNVGIHTTILNDRLGFKAEYFNDKYYDLLMQRGRNTTLLGNTYPEENIGQNRYTGWDFEMNWQQSVSDFNYSISANATVQNSEVLFIDEVFRPFQYMERTGRRVGQRFGYEAIGLFQSQAEINSSATIQGYTPQPGDIKYKDLNNDGVIDVFDQGAIGTDKPLFYYGLSAGLNWKGFDVSALVQGVKNRDIYLSGNSYYEFQNNGFGQAYEHHLTRWTPGTAATATYPRLSIGTNVNNQSTSSYWLRSGDYVRLRLIEIGYSIPEKLVQRIKLKSSRLFVSGTNLFTHSKIDNMDPEVFNGSYPIQKLVNLGINIKL